MSDGRYAELLGRLVDEELSFDELDEFVRLVQGNSSRVEELQNQLEAAEMIALSEDDLRDCSLFVSALHDRISEDPFVSQVRSEMKRFDVGSRSQDSSAYSWAFAAVALLALVAAGVLFSQANSRATPTSVIAEIVTAHGAIQWTGDGGSVVAVTESGCELRGGTLESLSADAWAELQFRDGTVVTVSGRSLLTISEQHQKVVRLRYGNVSANVVPQPTGNPMLVYTPSAELRVLGTQFNVDAQPEATRLVVNEGRVRLKRSTDGKEIEVKAHQEVTASIENHDGLISQERGSEVSTWKSDLKSDVVVGKWVSEIRTLAIQLKKALSAGEMTVAEAHAAYKDAATLEEESGSVWSVPGSFGSLVVLSASRSSTRRVVLTANTKFRIQGRLYSSVEVDLDFGMSVNEPNGGFAGKYSVSVAPGAMRRDDNTFDFEIPIGDFKAVADSRNSPTGKELRDWWCVTKSKSAKLEIIHVELIE